MSHKTQNTTKPKVLSLKQMLAKTFDFLEDLPIWFEESFGRVTSNFVMFIWAQSGAGKSTLTTKLIKVFMIYGKVLYVGLEEGHSATMQERLIDLGFTNEEFGGKIAFTDHTMTYDTLFAYLKKRNSGQFIVIDSVQYLDMDYKSYKRLKERFHRKTFILISHADGKNPRGSAAQSIRYDADVKVYIDGYITQTDSRFRGNKPLVIWEEGAKKHHGRKYRDKIK